MVHSVSTRYSTEARNLRNSSGRSRARSKSDQGMGLVSEACPRRPSKVCLATSRSGHTRYSTAGSSRSRMPAKLARFRDDPSSRAQWQPHNASELRRELKTEVRSSPTTMIGSSVHRIAGAHPRCPEQRLADALTGARAPLSRGRDGTLCCGTRSRGWRPLVMGKLGEATIFASESCALVCSGTLIREASAARSSHRREGIVPASLEKRESKKCVFEYVYFSRPDSQCSAARSTGREVSRTSPRRDFPPQPLTGVSVPDSSNSAALGFAEDRDSFELALIAITKLAYVLHHSGRGDAKVKVKYNAVGEVLRGKSVVMVDDSIGAAQHAGSGEQVPPRGRARCTLRCHLIAGYGACYYGIDTPRGRVDRRQHDVLKSPKRSGGTLGYRTLDGMLESVPGGPSGFCHASSPATIHAPPADPRSSARRGC